MVETGLSLGQPEFGRDSLAGESFGGVVGARPGMLSGGWLGLVLNLRRPMLVPGTFVPVVKEVGRVFPEPQT